jgi:ATP-dependent 26S proteasome regulatory subunit
MSRMTNHPLVEQIDLMLRSRYPLIYIVAAEEEPIGPMLASVCDLPQSERQLVTWDVVQGWSDNGSDKNSLMGGLLRVSREIEQTLQTATLYVFYDVHPFFQGGNAEKLAPIVRALKNLALTLPQTRSSIVFVSPTWAMPRELSDVMTVLDAPLPDLVEIDQMIQQTASPEAIDLLPLAREQLVKACQGLSRAQIRRVLAKAIAARQKITESEIAAILAEKQQIIRRTGILEFFLPQESLKQVGGLDNLKGWVRSRREAFTEAARRYGIPHPKGVLLAGIQGTGKSLSAKTIAAEWRLPLLRLDVGRLFGGLVGESESRMRQMIQLVEAVSPCILWIDEIDKAFGNIASGVDGDSGTSRRVFGTLITWMQEKQTAVFVVATANNVQSLPAELLRKGRFDEIFFLNLPSTQEREAIFRIFLQRLRPNRLREFDLAQLAWETRDFSGAEIEQVIVDGMYLAFSGTLDGEVTQRRDFATEDILSAIRSTVPLASISRVQIDALQRWAEQTGARNASVED